MILIGYCKIISILLLILIEVLAVEWLLHFPNLFSFMTKQSKLAHQRRQLGQYAASEGIRKAARVFGVSPGTARYWKLKILNPTFHPSTLGGNRKFFPDNDRMELLLWDLLEKNNTVSIFLFAVMCCLKNFLGYFI